MTYLTASKDALAKAIHDMASPVCPHWATGSLCERQADALIASGAIIDADTLADDEAAVERAARAMLHRWGPDEPITEGDRDQARRAIAAALTERSQ